MKICSKCGERLPFRAFCLDSAAPLGLRSICRTCDAERAQRWRQANPKKKAAQNRRYLGRIKDDPERLAIRQAKRRAYDQMRLEFLRRRRS